MVALNFAIPDNFTITIGGVDFTKCIEQFSIQRPLPDPKTPATWTGSIQLSDRVANPSYLPETLNPFTNSAARWDKGCHQIILSIGSSRICPPLYILSYQYDPETGEAEMRVGDDLTLRSDYRPVQSYAAMGMSATSAVGVSNVASVAMGNVGLTGSFGSLPGSIPVAPNKLVGSWIEWAQTFLGERGYWLYVHTDGTVRNIQYPSIGDTAVFTRPRSRVDTYRPIFVEVPKERYRCSGSAQKFVPPDPTSFAAIIDDDFDDLVTFDGAGNPIFTTALVRRTTTQILTSTATSFVKSTIIEEALGALDPELFPGSATRVVTRRTIEYHTADFSESKVRQIRTVTDAPLPAISAEMNNVANERIRAANSGALSAGNKLAYWNNILTAALTTIETFNDGGTFSPTKGMMVDRRKNSYGFRRVGKRDYQYGLLVEQEIETFRRNNLVFSTAENPPTTHYTRDFKRFVRAESNQITASGNRVYNLRGLNIVDSQEEPGATPGQFPTLKAQSEVGNVGISGLATFLPVSASPFYQKEEPVSCSTLSTNNECTAFAQLVGNLAHQSYYGRSTNLPIPPEWLANPYPFMVAAIHDGKFVLCNDSIQMSGSELEISWQMYRLGVLSPVVPEVGEWTPTTPTNTYVVKTQVERSGITPIVNWSAPIGQWQRGGAAVRSGNPPIISWSTPRPVVYRSGSTPIIEWSVVPDETGPPPSEFNLFSDFILTLNDSHYS